MRRPITPAVHGALDNGYGAALLVLPRLLDLHSGARTFFLAAGATVGVVFTLTDWNA